MGAFLRQMVAMAALWAIEELLLPEGNLQKAARLAVSLLVMTVLLTSMVDLLRGWAGQGVTDWVENMGAIAWESSQGAEAEQASADYERYYLQAQANQAEALCLRMAEKAGYQAETAVYLLESGGLESIRMRLRPIGEDGNPPLISAEELRRAIAAAFQAEEEKIQVIVGEGG
jgi:stage III sporulation protein AF